MFYKKGKLVNILQYTENLFFSMLTLLRLSYLKVVFSGKGVNMTPLLPPYPPLTPAFIFHKELIYY